MAKQSQKGGGTWARYMRQKAFRLGWQEALEGQPFCDDVAKKVGYYGSPLQAKVEAEYGLEYDHAASLQRLYEAGRLMAVETRMPIPAVAARQTKEIVAVVAAAPAMRRLFAVEQDNAREEAKRAASLRMKLRHHQKQKEAA